MRLLHATTHKFHEYVGDDIPEYAILSHTWGEGEVTFNDMRPDVPPETWKTKLGWSKIEKCCLQALNDSIQFVWVDTCCIDKSSSAELQEAINSMFRWYEGSTECYAFLNDFEAKGNDLRRLGFARWWARGWTLQELLAPGSVRFFDSGWHEFGDKVSLRHEVALFTGISEATLLGTVVEARQALDRVSVAQRMSWAARRKTTRPEDMAYSLLGVFGVNMPMLYGEGGAAAFYRLQVEIMGSSADQSLLAWGFARADSGVSLWGVSNALAMSPADFAKCGDMLAWGVARPGDTFTMTQRGLRLRLPVVLSVDGGNLIYCALNCTVAERVPAEGEDGRALRVLAVPFLRPKSRASDGLQPHKDEYYRLMARLPLWVERKALEDAPRVELHVPRVFRHGDTGQWAYQRLRVHLDLLAPPTGWYVAGIFPPEKSLGDCIFVKPQQSEFTGAVIIHLANSSRVEGVSDFALVLELKQSTNCGEGLTQPSASDTTVRNASELDLGVKQPITMKDLRERVFNIVASVAQVRGEMLTEATGLRELGVDSLCSIEIADRLARDLDLKSHTQSILVGTRSIGDIIRQLRFVTRPSFAVVGSYPTLLEPNDRHRLGLAASRFIIGQAKYCTIQMPRNSSLADLGVGDELFWLGLRRLSWNELEISQASPFIGTPIEGFFFKVFFERRPLFGVIIQLMERTGQRIQLQIG
jgi:acyl carrier protein